MDLWVVAAAAGAGYIAKNLQNLSVDKRESSVTSSSYSYHSESRNLLQQFRDKTCPLRRLAESRVLDESVPEMDSDSKIRVSEIEELGFRNWELGVASSSGDDCNLGWVSNTEGSVELQGFKDRSLGRAKRGKFITNRRQFRQNWGLNSFGTCLDEQQCNEQDNMEDNSTCLYPLASPVRPVLVTDWSRMVDRSETEELPMKPEQGSRYLQQCDSREGLPGGSIGHNTMLLFITGMIVGILSATTAWKTEVDKLNKLLKQMQNLVQDLQDELDMKEMLMVKELPVEGHPSPGDCQSLPVLVPIASPSGLKLTDLDILKANVKRAEGLELLSTIEAELQAELETLENNMSNSTYAVDRISGFVELDPDFEPDIVKGELKPAVANAPTDSETESTDTTMDCSQPANYSVSPWELSLRLHELIESRLEMRIKELETALSNNLNQAQVLDSLSSETESSSVHQSPTCICDEYDKSEDRHSLNDSNSCTNAYEELNGTLPQATKHERPVELVHSGKQMSTSFVSNVDSESDDEGTDESEMMLIKQIVERRRSGSNFKLNWG